VVTGRGKDSGHYVVVSYGRDGSADFRTEEEYFALEKTDIRGLPDRDIVFRDGRCITNAGKDPHSDYPRPD
jgi:hypothetical protein